MEFILECRVAPKSLHWLPHFVLDKLLLQDLTYQTHIHGVVASLHKAKKGLWPPFLYPREFVKLKILSTLRKRSIFFLLHVQRCNFQRHDPQGKLKEYLKQISFIWKYSHDDLLLRELSQQWVLVKSKIPTPEQMIQIDREVERKKVDIDRSKSIIE